MSVLESGVNWCYLLCVILRRWWSGDLATHPPKPATDRERLLDKCRMALSFLGDQRLIACLLMNVSRACLPLMHASSHSSKAVILPRLDWSQAKAFIVLRPTTPSDCSVLQSRVHRPDINQLAHHKPNSKHTTKPTSRTRRSKPIQPNLTQQGTSDTNIIQVDPPNDHSPTTHPPTTPNPT